MGEAHKDRNQVNAVLELIRSQQILETYGFIIFQYKNNLECVPFIQAISLIEKIKYCVLNYRIDYYQIL